MKDTGYSLTEEEIKSIKTNLNTPLIAIHLGPRESAVEQVHRYALAKGLPEIEGYYGASLETGIIYSI